MKYFSTYARHAYYCHTFPNFDQTMVNPWTKIYAKHWDCNLIFGERRFLAISHAIELDLVSIVLKFVACWSLSKVRKSKPLPISFFFPIFPTTYSYVLHTNNLYFRKKYHLRKCSTKICVFPTLITVMCLTCHYRY